MNYQGQKYPTESLSNQKWFLISQYFAYVLSLAAFQEFNEKIYKKEPATFTKHLPESFLNK